MRKIEVEPGYYEQDYHEWNAYANGNLFYVFSDTNLFDDILKYDGLENVADEYIRVMQNDLNDDSFVHVDLTPEELTELKKQLVTAWAQHLGVS